MAAYSAMLRRFTQKKIPLYSVGLSPKVSMHSITLHSMQKVLDIDVDGSEWKHKEVPNTTTTFVPVFTSQTWNTEYFQKILCFVIVNALYKYHFY